MRINRLTAHAPRTNAVAQELATLHTPCVGCKGCTGVCHTLIEMLTLPEMILVREAQ